MGEYKRPVTGPQSPQFQRWLVVLDVMPNVGTVTGFQTVELPRRTLNVKPYSSLFEALGFIRDASRSLRSLVFENDISSPSLRYSFLVLDAGSRTCVTVDLIAEWAKLDSSFESPRGNASALDLDRTKAAQVARTLSGRAMPATRLLDGTDPIPIFTSRSLWHADEVPQSVPPTELQPFDGAVTGEEYDEASRKARAAGDTVWIYGLITLPSLIDASIDRVLRKRVKELIHSLRDEGYGEGSPRFNAVSSVLNRLVSGQRLAVARSVYGTIIRDRVDYSNQDKLDLLTRAKLESSVFTSIPAVLQPAAA